MLTDEERLKNLDGGGYFKELLERINLAEQDHYILVDGQQNAESCPLMAEKHCRFGHATESSIKKSNVYNCWWRNESFFVMVVT